jgi:uncharacterized repeat protein (TIGR01451 family)
MKRAILLRFVVLCFVFLGYQAKAQMYFIPDLNFRAYLQANFASCMNATGDSLDGSCPAVLNAITIDVSMRNIVSLNGIQAFQNLQQLYCAENLLTSLPNLPSSLIYLRCDKNQLTSLPSLPFTLEYLFCSWNQLTYLPSLPPLKHLECYNNQLTNLSSLPSFSLIELNCSYNQLTTLSFLSFSMKRLVCSHNQLTDILNLSPSLIVLECGYNQLTSIPALPSSLTGLGCGFNQISSLPALPNSLTGLNCSVNQLTSLPSLPSTLIDLDCSYNMLLNLPSLPSSLTDLICHDNQLTSLPALPSTLKILDCSSNLISSFPAISSSLTDLNCSGNLLTSLPVLPSSLTILRCSFNYLKCLPDLKNVKTLNISNTGIQCLPNYGKITSCTPPLSNFPLCGIYNTNSCEVAWNLSGNVYFDSDSNCVKSIADSGIANQKVQLFKNGSLFQQTYSNNDGNYYFDTDSLTIYSTSIDSASLPFSILCPLNASYIDTLTAIDSIKSNRDFAAKCKGIDLAVTSIYGTGFRPASQRPLIIHAGDFSNNFGGKCAAGVSGSVQIIVSGPCEYVSASSGALLPTTINGDTLVYSIADFGSINYKTAFVIEVLVDTFAVLGSQICVNVEISTTANEIDTTNNNLTQCFNVVNSYDPNDKSVYPTQLQPGVNNWLTYNINFQNTGNTDAIDIFITDTLDAKLDWSTFELLSYSHLPLVQLYNTGIIKFNYPKIYLPDSTNNEPESHGYLQFRIKSKNTLLPGDVINNKANIYFDFNPPIITNTATATACPVLSNISASICFNTTYDFNGQIISSPGIYRDTLPSQSGCDSIVTLNLSLIPTQVNINDNFCQGSVYNFNNQQLTSPGIYIDTLANVLGCDSIVELTLSMNATYQDTITATICNYEQYTFNNLQLNQSGIYQALYATTNGCDSIEVLNLSVLLDITNAITQNNAQLSTSGVGSSYNWIDCTTGLIVPNEIANVFNPPAAGSYSAVVYYGNCIDTSACIQFVTTGIAELNEALVIINPNPFQEELTITRKDNRKEILEVYNLLGEQILQTEIQDKRTTLSTQTWPAGIYILKFIGDRDVITTRVVKN